MPGQSDIQLTTKDISVLETMLERCDDLHGPFAALLRRKLDHATIFLRDDIPPCVVTLNSHVIHSADGKPAGPHLIVQCEGQEFPDFALSIHTLHGLALLGLSEGQATTINCDDGSQTRLVIEKVTFQPEADMRDRGYRMAGERLRADNRLRPSPPMERIRLSEASNQQHRSTNDPFHD